MTARNLSGLVLLACFAFGAAGAGGAAGAAGMAGDAGPSGAATALGAARPAGADPSIREYLETYRPGGAPVPRVRQPGPPPSVLRDGELTVRMMPPSFSGDLNGAAAPATWPGRTMIVWGRVDGGTPPYTFTMEFGDGSAPVGGAVDGGLGRKPNYIAAAHAYAGGGPKTARLTVTDLTGAQASRDVPIYVQPFTNASVEMLLRRNAAIQDGLRWLYLQQLADGSWPGGGDWDDASATAAAVSAFEVRGHTGGNNPVRDVYAEFVRKGLDFLLSTLTTQAIDPQPMGNPDSNRDGVGIRSADHNRAYEHGVLMYALALSREPDQVAVEGRPGIAGRTYREILTNMVDQLSWSQGDDPTYGGGWRYNIGYSWDGADNSAIQWVSIALDAAARPQNLFGIQVPAFVKTQMSRWLAYSRCSDGGYGYTGPDYWCNQAKTASGVFSEYYCGRTADDPVVQGAIGWLDAHWCDPADEAGQSCGQFWGNFYAMYACKKALYDLGVRSVGAHDWDVEYVRFLVDGYTTVCGSDSYHQRVDHVNPELESDGSWPIDCYVVNCETGATAFALLTLIPGISCDLYAVAEADPQSVCPDAPLRFDGSGSYTTCPDREILQWLWDFDAADGANIHASDAAGVSVLKEDGYPLPPGQLADTVRVTLWVIDRATGGGADQDTSTTTIDVRIHADNHAPVACLNGPFTAPVGEPIRLDACCSYDPDTGGQCAADSIARYEWDFGGEGTVDYVSTTCVPDTVLVFDQEFTLSVVLGVVDTHGTRSESAVADLIWSSERDLSVTGEDIRFDPPDPSCNDSVTVCAAIHTRITGGGPDIPQARIRMYQGEAVPLRQIHEVVLYDLADGDVDEVCFRWLPPADSLQVPVIVVADADGEVQESSETNNTATRVLILTLGATRLTAPADSAEGVPARVEFAWLPGCGTTFTLEVAADPEFANLVVREPLIPEPGWAALLPRGHTYWWRVQAHRGPVEGPWSQIRRFATEPVPAPLLSAPPDNAEGLPRTLDLVWHDRQLPSDGSNLRVTTYDLQVARDAGFSDLVLDLQGLVDTTRTVGPLTGGIWYWWRVRAGDGEDLGLWSASRRFLPRPPQAPDLAAPADEATALPLRPALSWRPAVHSVRYRLQLALDDGFTQLVVDHGGIVDTVFVPDRLAEETRYSWRVEATEADSAAAWSEVRAFMTGPLGAPLLVQPADGATELPRAGTTLVWSRSDQADAYEVQVARDDGFTDLLLMDTQADTSRAIGPLAGGTWHYWRVRASVNKGLSAWSAVSRFQPRPAAAPALVGPADHAVTPRQVALAWHTTPFATRYRVQLAADAGFEQIVLDARGLTDTTCAAGPLANGTTWYWKAAALEADSATAWSGARSFSIRPLAAPVLTAPADSAAGQPATVTFSWQASLDASGYRLQVARSPDFSAPVEDRPDLVEPGATIGPLQEGVWYWWRVMARAEGAGSSWSEVRAFRTLRTAVATVHPGDTNNDGRVDARDVIPIGLHYERRGAARPDSSLDWNPQPLYTAWDPPAACHADCNGDGRVLADDIAGVIENWNARVGSPRPVVDREAVCLGLIREIDALEPRPGLLPIRNACLEYLRVRLGVRLEFRVEPIVPNPFRRTAAIRFTLPGPVPEATLAVYNVRGSLVWKTSIRNAQAGTSTLTWNGTDLQGARSPAGIYFYRFAAGDRRASGKITLIR